MLPVQSGSTQPHNNIGAIFHYRRYDNRVRRNDHRSEIYPVIVRRQDQLALLGQRPARRQVISLELMLTGNSIHRRSGHQRLRENPRPCPSRPISHPLTRRRHRNENLFRSSVQIDRKKTRTRQGQD